MNTQATTDQLVSDLKNVMTDAEALLKATSAQTGDRIQEVRARAEAVPAGSEGASWRS